MREIKFRAIDDVFGEIIEVDNITTYDNYQYAEDRHERSVRCNTETMMQFTGLKDSNGVEIYERDIIKIVSCSNNHHQLGATENRVVNYFMGNACLCVAGDESGVPIYPLNVNHYLEIIGNTHQNPELVMEKTGNHWSDCSVHNMPAYPEGPCDCDANAPSEKS